MHSVAWNRTERCAKNPRRGSNSRFLFVHGSRADVNGVRVRIQFENSSDAPLMFFLMCFQNYPVRFWAVLRAGLPRPTGIVPPQTLRPICPATNLLFRMSLTFSKFWFTSHRPFYRTFPKPLLTVQNIKLTRVFSLLWNVSNLYAS